MYHNSTESLGPELRKYQDKAKTQEERILAFMKLQRTVTPSLAVRWIFKDSVPITSVRRALTGLTNSGDIVKTTAQTKGPYGRPEFIWELADKHRQQRLF